MVSLNRTFRQVIGLEESEIELQQDVQMSSQLLAMRLVTRQLAYSQFPRSNVSDLPSAWS